MNDYVRSSPCSLLCHPDDVRGGQFGRARSLTGGDSLTQMSQDGCMGSPELLSASPKRWHPLVVHRLLSFYLDAVSAGQLKRWELEKWELQSGESISCFASSTCRFALRQVPVLNITLPWLRRPRRRPRQLSMSLVDRVFLIQGHLEKQHPFSGLKSLSRYHNIKTVLPMDYLQLLEYLYVYS